MWGKNPPSIIFVRFGHALRVVVVHLCLELKLIRHRWGAFLVNVGQVSKTSHVTCEQSREYVAKACHPKGRKLQSMPKQTKIIEGGFFPHKKALFEGSAHQKYCLLCAGHASTTTTCSGRGVPCTGVTKPCGCCEACHSKGWTLQACPKRTKMIEGGFFPHILYFS